MAKIDEKVLSALAKQGKASYNRRVYGKKGPGRSPVPIQPRRSRKARGKGPETLSEVMIWQRKH